MLFNSGIELLQIMKMKPSIQVAGFISYIHKFYKKVSYISDDIKDPILILPFSNLNSSQIHTVKMTMYQVILF